MSNDDNFQRWKVEAGDCLVIVNDGTRPTPTAEILASDKDFFGSECVHYIIATGAHRAPEGDEWAMIFGDLYAEVKGRIHIHDARDVGSLSYYGTTARGTEVYFNKILKDFPRILAIGSVEPHYFAGYTGGRKAFMPGIAGYDSITANHKLALQAEAALMKIADNPVHDDMVEASRMISQASDEVSIFSIMSVLDRQQEIYSLHCGGLEESFLSAVEIAKRVFAVPVQKAADIIITYAAAPMNKDLFQSQKAIENVRGVLSPGGIVILVSECDEGIGDTAFYDLLALGRAPDDVLMRIRRGYKLGYHKAVKFAELTSTADIFAVTGIDAALLEAVFIRPFNSLQAALDEACEIYMRRSDKKPFVMIVPDGSLTVPMLEN